MTVLTIVAGVAISNIVYKVAGKAVKKLNGR